MNAQPLPLPDTTYADRVILQDMQAKQELTQLKERLQKQISVLESEMVAVDKTIQLLEREDRSTPNAIQDKRFRKLGLSDAIRQVIASEWISPTEVRNELMQGGYPNVDKSKLLGSVFATMKRLGRSQLEVKKIDGKLKYRLRDLSSTYVEMAPQSNGNGTLRKVQIHEWLKTHGPATRKEVVAGTGLPDGTVGKYLSIKPDLFENREGKWHAR